MEKKSLRNILFILFFLLILLLGTYFFINMRQQKIRERNDSVMVQTPGTAMMEDKASESAGREESRTPAISMEEEAEPQEMTAAPAEPEAPSLPERYIVSRHEVEEGESFSLITGYYWEDIFLWPDLYVRNDMRTDDPDLIFPEEIVDIYNRLGSGDSYTPLETEELMKSYLRVYRIYKKLGPEKNNSVWSLLWCAAKYDHDFLDTYADMIDPEDLAMARKYIAEEGFLE